MTNECQNEICKIKAKQLKEAIDYIFQLKEDIKNLQNPVLMKHLKGNASGASGNINEMQARLWPGFTKW